MTEDRAKYGADKQERKLSYKECAEALLGDPGVRFWLKDAIRELDQKDPADSMNDAAMLFKLQQMRVDELIGKEPHKEATNKKE